MVKLKLPLVPQFYVVNRWLSLLAGMAMSSISGTAYLFPAIAPSLKDQMGYNQAQINLVGTLGNVGSYAGILPSIFYNVFGPRMTCLLAAAALFGGYFLIYLSAIHAIPSNYIIIGLLFMVMGNGTSASYTAALTANIPNYSQQSRGILVGVMASCYGISSAMFSFCYSIFFKKQLNPMLLFLAISTGVVPLIATFFTNINPPDHVKEEQSGGEFSEKEDEEAVAILASQEKSLNSSAPREEVFKDVNTLYMLLSVDFWLLFILFFAGVGSGITMLNNLGSMVISYGGKNGDQNPMVIVFSFANCTGRIVAGVLSDYLSAYLTRVTVLNVSVLGMGLFLYIFVYASVPVFYVAIIGCGLMYGSIFAMVPSYLSERFGQKYFAINFSIIALAPTLGSYLLSTLMASKIYEAHTRNGSTKCFGRACFQITFICLTGLCVAAFILGLVLMYRSRRMYSRIYKFHKMKNASRPTASLTQE